MESIVVIDRGELLSSEVFETQTRRFAEIEKQRALDESTSEGFGAELNRTRQPVATDGRAET